MTSFADLYPYGREHIFLDVFHRILYRQNKFQLFRPRVSYCAVPQAGPAKVRFPDEYSTEWVHGVVIFRFVRGSVAKVSTPVTPTNYIW